MAGERLKVGYVAGVHGVHGAVRIQLFDPASRALEPGTWLTLCRDEAGSTGSVGCHRVCSVVAMPGHTGRHRVALEGIDTREAADALRSCVIEVERAQLPALEPGEFYLADTIGRIVQRRVGERIQELGSVVGWMNNGAQDLLEVQWHAGGGRPQTWLLPLVPGVIVELGDAHILVDVPLGMLPDELEEA